MKRNPPDTTPGHRRFAMSRIPAGATGLLFVLATVAMLRRIEPFYSFYYSFAWWTYILFIQLFLHSRRRVCLLFSSPAEFRLLLPLSVTLWLVFELFNFRLSNWHYLDVPSNILIRWPGYAVAFATVLPGIYSTVEFLDYLGAFRNVSCRPLDTPARLYSPLMLAGTACLLLPLLLPRFFFPLVWLGFLFLLEPVNHRHGAPSFLRDLQNGSPRRFYLFLLAGLVCGLLWEMWNFRAGSKWVYTVPFVGRFKVFEMPVLGFLGFPPFAVTCAAVESSFFLLVRETNRKYGRRENILLYSIGAIAAIAFAFLVFSGIDRFTIYSYRDWMF